MTHARAQRTGLDEEANLRSQFRDQISIEDSSTSDAIVNDEVSQSFENGNRSRISSNDGEVGQVVSQLQNGRVNLRPVGSRHDMLANLRRVDRG